MADAAEVLVDERGLLLSAPGSPECFWLLNEEMNARRLRIAPMANDHDASLRLDDAALRGSLNGGDWGDAAPVVTGYPPNTPGLFNKAAAHAYPWHSDLALPNFVGEVVARAMKAASDDYQHARVLAPQDADGLHDYLKTFARQANCERIVAIYRVPAAGGMTSNEMHHAHKILAGSTHFPGEDDDVLVYPLQPGQDNIMPPSHMGIVPAGMAIDDMSGRMHTVRHVLCVAPFPCFCAL